jgi:hypothetical protein
MDCVSFDIPEALTPKNTVFRDLALSSPLAGSFETSENSYRATCYILDGNNLYVFGNYNTIC